jgi:RecB family exonuclease
VSDPAEGARHVGSSFLVPTERHVERDEAGGAITARRFFEHLAAELHPDRRPASRAARRLAVRLALETAATSPALARLYAGSGAERAALVSAVDATLGSLRDSGATADDLRRTGTPRGAEIARLLEAVDAALHAAGLVDSRALVSAEAIEASAEPRARRITTTGIVRFRGALLDRLIALHHASRRAGGGVAIRLPRFDDAEHPMSNVAARIERHLAAEDEAPEIEWLELADPQARVVEARGPSAEARGVAGVVLAAVREGVAPEAIAVCVPRGDESMLSPLRAALIEAGVPFSEQNGRPARSVPEVRAALSLLTMAARWITRDGLVELLCLPSLHAGAFVGARDEQQAAARAARLAHKLRALPIVRDATGQAFVDALRKSDTATSSAHAPDDAAWAADATSKLCRAIVALRSASGIEAVGGAWLALIERMRLGAPSAREIAMALASSTPGALPALGEGAVAMRALRTAVDEIVDARRMLAKADDRTTAEDLAAEMDIALAASRTSPRGGSARAGAVRVTGPEEIAGASHDLVVITRLATSAYRPARGQSLLDEATRKRLPESRRPPSHREAADEQEAELAWAARSAASVVFSFATTDDDGREAEPPHPLVGRAIEAGTTPAIEPTSRLSQRASVLSDRGAELVALARGAQPATDLVARLTIERSRLAFFLDPRAQPDAYSGRVEGPVAAELARRFGGTAPDQAAPVSAIEVASVCAFRAFALRVLRAHPVEEAADPLSPRERGELTHLALYKAYEANRAMPPSAGVPERLAAARAAGARAIGLDEPGGPLRREGKRRLLAEAVDLLADELGSPTDLAYRFGERRFGVGEDEPWGPLALPRDPPLAGDAPLVWVEGRLDRVDTSPDGRRMRVVDYKTGKTVPSTKALGETAFQLPLYARVVARQKPVELGVAYLSASAVLSGQRKRDAAKTMTEEDLDAAAERAAEIVHGVWSGRVAPRPVHPSACRRCAARDLCRKPAVVPPAEDDDGGGS